MAGYRILVCDPLAEEGLQILAEIGQVDCRLQLIEVALPETTPSVSDYSEN